MRIVTQRHAGWLIHSCPDFASPEETLGCFERLGAGGRILKHDHRTLIKLVRGPRGDTLVLKQPKQKNTSRWIRLTTLYRDGEALALFKGLVALAARRIPAPRPVAAFERRRAGMVVDSWVVYRWRDGEPCTRGQYGLVVDLVQRLHAAGLRHGDVHIENFLYDGREAFVIDYRLRRNHFGRIGENYDWICLMRRKHVDPGIRDLVQGDRSSLAWRLAAAAFWYRWPGDRTRRLAA